MNVRGAEFISANATKHDRSHMRELTELAYITVFDALELEYGKDEVRSETERRQCSVRAGVAADYLFGKEPGERAPETLDLAREQETARNWLKRNARMRELVLESLRVLNMLSDDSRTRTGPVGEGLLMAYGQGVFRAPDPAAYEALVHGAIYSLPLHTQQSIFYGWAKTRSCH
ncbi:MAG TPA: hypothetical protein VMH26_11905 [Burkholderiales bacterium]|nr:hypothetical protein [Burkholderiales bacterium]